MFLLRRRKSKAELVKERVHDLTDTFTDKAVDLSGRAAVALAPKVVTARDAATAAYEQASTRVRDDVVPKVRDDYAVRAREVAAPAVNAMLKRNVIEEKPKKHRLRKVLALIGIGGAVAFVAKKFRSGGAMGTSSFGPSSASDAWSSTTPTRPTAVPDATASDPLTADAAASDASFAKADDRTTSADVDAAASDDEGPGFSTEFTTTPPTEAAKSAESDSGSAPKPKPRKPGSS